MIYFVDIYIHVRVDHHSNYGYRMCGFEIDYT